MYGSRWTANIDGIEKTAVREWTRALEGMTPEKIRAGLDTCQQAGNGWPPTLPEFVAMCEGRSVNEYGLDHVPVYHRAPDPARALVAPQDPGVRHKAMAEIRAILGMPPKQENQEGTKP